MSELSALARLAPGGASDAPRPRPELRSYTPAWHDRIVDGLTGLLYGPNANAQQRANVNHIAGPDNPFNIPAQINQGYNTAKLGIDLGDPAQSALGALQMAMSLPFGIGKAPAIRGYHGTTAQFDKFDLRKVGGMGVNVGTKAQAERFAGVGATDVDGGKMFPIDIDSSAKLLPVHPGVADEGNAWNLLTYHKPGRHGDEYDQYFSPNQHKFSADEYASLRERVVKAAKYDPEVSEINRGTTRDYKGREVGFYGPTKAETGRANAAARNWLKERGYSGVEFDNVHSEGPGKTRMVWDNAKSATTGETIFDEKIIELLRKYGLAGLMAGGAAATAGTPADARPTQDQ